jgi:hypothetical protein
MRAGRARASLRWLSLTPPQRPAAGQSRPNRNPLSIAEKNEHAEKEDYLDRE